jgi:enoyl-CoA hydratase/carnithine racemase
MPRWRWRFEERIMADTVAIDDLQGGVRLITLNRPEKKNALTGAMYDAMRVALTEADASDQVGAVVFAGQPGMFSAGNDLADFLGQ